MNLMLVAITFFAAVAVGGIVYVGGNMVVLWFLSYEAQYVERAEQDLYGMFSNLSPQRILQASLGCFATVFVSVLLLVGSYRTNLRIFLSLLLAAILGGMASLLPGLILKRLSLLRLRRFDLQLLDALLSMSNALKAGFSIIQAFESIVEERRNPISQEFDLFLREIRLGVKFETASENLAARVPSEDLKIVLTGIETARLAGGNLTEVLDRLATMIRERMRIQGRIRSLTAQGRMQGWVVGAMPFALGVAIYFLQPSLMLTFIQSTAGIILILVMLLLQSIGFYLIRKIVTIDV